MESKEMFATIKAVQIRRAFAWVLAEAGLLALLVWGVGDYWSIRLVIAIVILWIMRELAAYVVGIAVCDLHLGGKTADIGQAVMRACEKEDRAAYFRHVLEEFLKEEGENDNAEL